MKYVGRRLLRVANVCEVYRMPSVDSDCTVLPCIGGCLDLSEFGRGYIRAIAGLWASKLSRFIISVLSLGMVRSKEPDTHRRETLYSPLFRAVISNAFRNESTKIITKIKYYVSYRISLYIVCIWKMFFDYGA